MIHYALSCENGHGFEAWFSSSEDYDRQRGMKLVSCPVCNSADVSKSLMAPSVATARKKEEVRTLAPGAAEREAVRKVTEIVTALRSNAEDVGERFADEARKIHYGEAEMRGIIGQASGDQVQALMEEGIEVAPLPVLPDDVN